MDENLLFVDSLFRGTIGSDTENHLGFIDLETTFPKVFRQKLLDCLNGDKFPFAFRKILATLFNLDFFSVLVNGIPGEFFPKNAGLQEGSSLSPILFIYIFEKVEVYLEQVRDSGVFFRGATITNLKFADDFLAVASNAWDLQLILSAFENFVNDFAMKINPGKCEYLVISNARNVEQSFFTLANRDIYPSDKVRYLGILLQPKRIFFFF